MVEQGPGGDPNKIIEIIHKYKHKNYVQGQFSDGIKSLEESAQNSSSFKEDGKSKNLLKTFN